MCDFGLAHFKQESAGVMTSRMGSPLYGARVLKGGRGTKSDTHARMPLTSC